MNATKPAPTILLVEDNPAHARLIMRRLTESRPELHIDHCADGEAALQYVQRCLDGEADRPDVILLDLRLPKVDGLEVLKHIKSSEVLKTIPVVVLTTSSAPFDYTEAYRHHANSYLIKPFNYQDFHQMAETLCAYWLTWNRS